MDGLGELQDLVGDVQQLLVLLLLLLDCLPLVVGRHLALLVRQVLASCRGSAIADSVPVGEGAEGLVVGGSAGALAVVERAGAWGIVQCRECL